MHGRHHPDGPRLLSEVLRIGASQGGCLGVSGGRFRIALVGLAFGAEFAPIYRDRPDVESVTICDSNKEVLDRAGDRFGIADRASSLDESAGAGRCRRRTPPRSLERRLAAISLRVGRFASSNRSSPSRRGEFPTRWVWPGAHGARAP